MLRIFLVWVVVLGQMQAQTASFPLESLSVEGTGISKDIVLDLAGLHVGAPVDQSALDDTSRKLAETGMFESVNYNYAQGPKKGYALTLRLADPKSLSDASIDIPGVNQDEVWQWLASRYPVLNRKCRETKLHNASLSESWKSIWRRSWRATRLASKWRAI